MTYQAEGQGLRPWTPLPKSCGSGTAGPSGVKGQSPLLVCLALSACGLFSPDKPDAPLIIGTTISTETVSLGGGYGLNLPKTLDGFTRTDPRDRKEGDDIVVDYARTIEPAPMLATVRVHRAGGKSSLDLLTVTSPAATSDRSSAALDASVGRVRRADPSAGVSASAPAFLVRFGAMQNGRAATLSTVDTIDGVRQPIALRIVTFCCVDQKWSYEFQFRSPAALAGTAGPITDFLRDVAWSPEPSGSIDKPE